MPLTVIPTAYPVAYKTQPGVTSTSDLNTGGYDFTIGGHGFRLASDQTNPYQRYSEPTTVHRFDNSLEPGEQTLSDLPWIKSQSSFHAGAGQLNLEQGFNSFQYQQEQVEHIRFDKSLGVDVWTPGVVSRLPDTKSTSLGITGITQVTVGGDANASYAIVGGDGVLAQVMWTGPDDTPTVTTITPDPSTFGSSDNWSVTSLTTDGDNYYGIIQLDADGFAATIRTYVVRGQLSSTDSPIAIYEVPDTSSPATRTNLCTNPTFETGTTGWTAAGSPAPTIAQSTSQAHSGTHSLKMTSGGAATFLPNVAFTATTVSGTTYTFSAWVYLTAGCPSVTAVAGSSFGTSTAVSGEWVRLNSTFTASSTSTRFGLECDFTNGTQSFYIDDALLEVGTTVGDFFDGTTTDTDDWTYAWSGTADASTSTATPTNAGAQVPGIVGWAKARLMAGLGNSLYELNALADPHSSLPSVTYTHPTANARFSEISDSPTGILAAVTTGMESSILQSSLDSSGGLPVLTGGSTIARFPPGERVLAIRNYLGTYLAIGTTAGIRIGTFDTQTGALVYGPLSVETTAPVGALCGRDRFCYGGYADQQDDGGTGLVRVDLTFPVDQSGRLAYAPDLRPVGTTLTNTDILWVDILPTGSRLVYFTDGYAHVEGDGPGTSGDSYLITSRIRFDTAEPKLWTRGRVHGDLSLGDVKVTGLTPFGDDKNLGTFGHVDTSDDSKIEYGLPSGLHEWIQLKFALIGSAATLSSYQAKAIPSPARQDIIQLSANCFMNETDRDGVDVTDPELPRQRWQNIVDLETAGNAVRFVEFTNSGSVAAMVYIDQIQYSSINRPSVDSDFGGIVSLKLRIL